MAADQSTEAAADGKINKTFRAPRYEMSEEELNQLNRMFEMREQHKPTVLGMIKFAVWYNPFLLVGCGGVLYSFVRGVTTMHLRHTTFKYMVYRVNWQAFAVGSALCGPLWHKARDYAVDRYHSFNSTEDASTDEEQ
eukprot:TRINITY_DN1889_c0_g1_i1.p1 TRINITY_DN1889_c0_g1~~TRINITY_DN1889_c0_g1_i1.p1  ORF type:complete len:152 (-),score=38.53 TRINITY_DN1889_c0_g1_i1:38-448(-)